MFRGLKRGSKEHRFGYENGVDLYCWIARPSVVLFGLEMKTLVRFETRSTYLAYSDEFLTIIDISSHLSQVENIYWRVFIDSVFCHSIVISQGETKKERKKNLAHVV